MSQVSNSTEGGLSTPTSTLGAMDVDTPQSLTGGTSQRKDILNPDTFSSQTTSLSTNSTSTRPTTTADANSGTTPPAKPKRRRITEEQFDILISVFRETDTPPYEVREELSKKLNMSTRDVQVWFQNRRAKVNREKQNAQNVVRHPNDAHFRGTRSRSQSDVGPSMGIQFVPIVSCDKAKNGAGPAMSQSLRGYRNPTPHYLHPPPIAPNPHFTGSAHHPHHPTGGMMGAVPTSHRMLTSSSHRAMLPAPREGGAIRTRRGSHSVSSNLAPITVAPYVIPQSSSTTGVSHSLSPIAPAFGAMSISPSHSPVALRTGQHHRPSPLNMAPRWSSSVASTNTHYYPAPPDSPMGYHTTEGFHPPPLTPPSHTSPASRYPVVGHLPRSPTYRPNNEETPYSPHRSSTSVLTGTMYTTTVGHGPSMTDPSGMSKIRTHPNPSTSGMPRRATFSHPMADPSGSPPRRNGVPTLPPLSSIADHLLDPPAPQRREIGKVRASPLSPPLSHRSTGSPLKNQEVGNGLSDSKAKGSGINMLASIAATIEHDECKGHQPKDTPGTPSKLPTPRSSVSGKTA
ncbi:hypothetical protein IWQ62_003927, partial [Dispira parvispora]